MSPAPDRPGPNAGRFFHSRGDTTGVVYGLGLDFISPASAKITGGGTLTITGSGFRTGPTGELPTVSIGGVAATGVVVVGPGSITATIPAHAAGAADVVVTDFYGSTDSLTNAFTYFESAVTSVSPNNGSALGGTVVTITGANFAPGATIHFGTELATGVTFVDSQHYIATSPVPITFGPVTVTVDDASLYGGFFYTQLTPAQALRRNPSVHVNHPTNGPATCEYTIDGRSVPPKASSEIEILDQDANVVFAGIAQIVTQEYEADGETEQLLWRVSATDYVARLNKRHPRETYKRRSITEIVLDLCTKYASWVDTSYVQTDLPIVDVVFDGLQDFASCLTALCQLMGRGHWRMDRKELHFFRVRPTYVASTNRTVTALATGPGTAPVATLSSSLPADGSVYPQGYYLFCSSFLFSNGTESVPGPWSNVVLLDGLHLPTVSSIAIGSGAGVYSVIGRRLYFKFFGIGGAVDVGFLADVADNTTTTVTTLGFSSSSERGVPHLPYVAPPLGSSSSVGLQQSSVSAREAIITLIPSLASLISYTFQAGNYVIAITNVYANGTESQSGQISNLVALDGKHAIEVTAGGGSALNGVPVIFRKVYGSRSGSAAQYTDIGATSFWGIIPDNTSNYITLAPGLKQLGSQEPPIAGDPLSDPTHEDGPNPEDVDNPAEINDSNLFDLLRQPQISSSEDVTQVRNRIVVIGRGVEIAPAVVLAPPSTNPLITGTPTITPTVDPYANSVAMYADGSVPTEYIANHPTLKPWRGGYPMNARWAALQKEQTALSATPAAPVVPVQYGRSGAPVPGASGYSPSGSTVGGLTGGMRGSWVPSTPTGAPADTVVTNWDGVDHFSAYLAEHGITAQYLLEHPYTVFMDLPEGYYESGGLAGVTPLNVDVPMVDDTSTDVGQPITPNVTRPMYVVDDLESQKYFGGIELDASGNPTDGIHEFYIDGSDLPSAEACITRGNAEAAVYAWPIVTVSWGTRNPKTKVGRMQKFNISHPPLKGEFAIQSVSIDQIKEEADELSPRYTATGSSVKFDLNDLLALIGDRSRQYQAPQSVGANPLTIVKATEQARAETVAVVAQAKTDIASTLQIQTVTITLTEAQCRALNGTPVTILAGIPGKVIIPWVFTKRVTVTTPFSAGVNALIRYNGAGTSVQVLTISLFANGTARYDGISYVSAGISNTNVDLRGTGVEITNIGGNPSSGIFQAPMQITMAYVVVDWPA